MYFHAHPNASVRALHMHVIDEAFLGPSFHVHQWKNLSAHAVVEALEAELEPRENYFKLVRAPFRAKPGGRHGTAPRGGPFCARRGWYPAHYPSCALQMVEVRDWLLEIPCYNSRGEKLVMNEDDKRWASMTNLDGEETKEDVGPVSSLGVPSLASKIRTAECALARESSNGESLLMLVIINMCDGTLSSRTHCGPATAATRFRLYQPQGSRSYLARIPLVSRSYLARISLTFALISLVSRSRSHEPASPQVQRRTHRGAHLREAPPQ